MCLSICVFLLSLSQIAKTMIKKSSNNCNKKSTLNGVKSRYSKLKCATHGEVSGREPCVRCSNCNKTETSQNKSPSSGKQLSGQRQIDKGMGDNEIIYFKPKRSSFYSSEIGNKKYPQKTIRSTNHVLDESVDIIPTKLHQDKLLDSVPCKISSQNDFYSASSNELSPVVQRTTWDCILREQNIDLVMNKLQPKSKTSSLHMDCQQKSKTISPYKLRLQEQDKANLIKSSHSGQTNKHVKILEKCEFSSCLHNTRRNKDRPIVGNRPIIHCDTQHSSIPSNCSKLPTKQDFKNCIFTHCTCSTTNPVLTLDLLVKELRGKLQRQADDDELQRIILDMENALSSFPAIPGQQNGTDNKIPQPQEFKKTIQKKFDIGDCKSVEQLHLKLEQSCQFLQDVYDQLHEAGKKHREEKERLSSNLAECRKLLAISKSKEKDYEIIIKELKLSLLNKSSKTDQHVQAIHDLTQVISRLQEENKCIAPLQASQTNLYEKYHEAVADKERINSELQLLKIEKEKLSVLMEVKDNELTKMKRNFEDIKTMFGNHLINLEDVKEPENINLDSTLSSVWDKELDEQFRPICSSPTSSIPGSSPSPYSSWQVISSIIQKPKATIELKKGIQDLFAEMKKQTKELNPNKLLPMPMFNYGSGISDSNDDDGPQFKSVPKLNIPSDILESDQSL